MTTPGGLDDELFGTPMAEAGIGPARRNPTSDPLTNAKPGDLIPAERSADAILEDGDETGIPDQEEFFRSPARFGSIPVDKEPLGWDRRQKFNKLYPFVSLPTQVVERVSFGHPELEPNRLIWGDNLHVMRQLPSESIDLIYIDPPFFSGRQYNVIFGDQNESRSFNDVWDAGMPGYLEWLNARLFEMKRLLTATGAIYVHLDWHAAHYVKVELDKIFGHQALQNEIIWCYREGINSKRRWNRKHDNIYYYRKGESTYFDPSGALEPHSESTLKKYRYKDEQGWYRLMGRGIVDSPIRSARDVAPEWETSHPDLVYRHYLKEGTLPVDYWNIDIINQAAKERIGYPTQKPERLLERIVAASCPREGVVADFFVGGGTTAAVAQRLGRRWIACDQSRVAVAVTADRLAKQGEQANLPESNGGGSQTSPLNTGGPMKPRASPRRRRSSSAASWSMPRSCA